ncbi:MAG TPA: hypothetical protein EYN66_19350 [Myxococcales bacterium]|nr:hypothetical protein [Myxococcales bacterium]
MTDIPGTTRDFLEESIDLRGVPVTLIDTAGLRNTDNPIEEAGVERSWSLAEKADLILLLTDPTQPELDVGELDSLDQEKVFSIRTKADLASGDVSVVTGEGIDELMERIYNFALPENSTDATTQVLSSARHHEALTAGCLALQNALTASQNNEPPDIISVEIQEAICQIGLIVGETTTEDLLDRIFSTFCIGK